MLRNGSIKSVLALLGAALVAQAAEGGLDTTFAGSGKGVTSFGSGTSATARAVALQPDGKIVTAGAERTQIALARFTVTGTLDATFGSGGKVTTTFGSRAEARAVRLQADGKIVVAGYAVFSDAGGSDFMVARYNADGSLDAGFGAGGLVRTNFGLYDEAEAVAIQADGKIVAGGHFLADPYHDLTIYALARYLPDGSPDPSFGSSGILTTMVGGSCANSSSQVQALAIQPDGKIVAAGYAIVGCGAQVTFAVVRYLSNGSLDSSFDLDGKVTRPVSNTGTRLGFAGAASVAIQPDGKIITAGTIKDGGRNVFAAARYTAAGFADLTFGTDGVVKAPVGTGSSEAFTMALQDDGKIVIGGDALSGGGRDFALLRLTAAGSPDPGFGANGVVTTPVGAGNDLLNAIAIQSDGKIVAAGVSDNPAGIALARYSGTVPQGGFGISSIAPSHGGSAGNVTATISGTLFQTGATARLRRSGYADIIATENLVAASGGAMLARFNLLGAGNGLWDVAITNPDATTAVLPGAFRVESGSIGVTWANVVGRPLARAGTPQKIYINYGHTGNDNALVIVLIRLTLDRTVDLGPIIEGMRIRNVLPDSINDPDMPELPKYFELVSTDPAKQKIVIPLIRMVAPGDVMTEAFSNPDCSAKVEVRTGGSDLEKCLVGIAQVAMGFVPGGPCVNAAINYINAISQQTPLYNVGKLDGPEAIAKYVAGAVIDMADCSLSMNPEASIAKNVVKILAIVMQADSTSETVLACGALAMKHFDSSLESQCVYSRDPNAKAGPAGAGAGRHVSGLDPLSYAVYFENIATATAPAQDVVVTDQLDGTKVDLDTFSLGAIIAGDRTISPGPGLSEFAHTEDLRPQQPVLLRIEAKLDKASGLATWRFTSLDPATGEKTLDPLAGFLPPDRVPPEGQGAVMFTVAPRPTLATGTTVENSASIVFDTNAPILTPVWLNTIDHSKPASSVRPLPAAQSSGDFEVQWSGADLGSGVAAYTIYVSDDGGPFKIWMLGTSLTQATFSGAMGHTYSFYSVAIDDVGNAEDPPASADATTRIAPPCGAVVAGVTVTRGGFRLNASTHRYVQSVILKNTGTAAIQGPVSLVLDTLSANAALYNKTGATACATPSGSPYANVNVGADAIFSPGESATVILEFTNPANQGISYTTRVLGGPGGR